MAVGVIAISSTWLLVFVTVSFALLGLVLHSATTSSDAGTIGVLFALGCAAGSVITVLVVMRRRAAARRGPVLAL